VARQNRWRSVEGESNLARRIQREREYRGMSYEVLAKAMTAKGCSIQGSAIYKMEKGTPPRRITVDELVTFADVFETTVEDLLTPVEVLRTKRAKQVLANIEEGDHAFIEAIAKLMSGYAEYFDLAAYEPDMKEYIDNHRFSATIADEFIESAVPLMTFRVGDEDIAVDTTELRDGLLSFYGLLVEQAGDLAESAIEKNFEQEASQ